MIENPRGRQWQPRDRIFPAMLSTDICHWPCQDEWILRVLVLGGGLFLLEVRICIAA